MLRLPRLSSSKGGLIGMSTPRPRRKRPRNGSPSGGSILTTSAPQSARMPPADGPATQNPSSTTRRPSIGPGMCAPFVRSIYAEKRRTGSRPSQLRGVLDHVEDAAERLGALPELDEVAEGRERVVIAHATDPRQRELPRDRMPEPLEARGLAVE